MDRRYKKNNLRIIKKSYILTTKERVFDILYIVILKHHLGGHTVKKLLLSLVCASIILGSACSKETTSKEETSKGKVQKHKNSI